MNVKSEQPQYVHDFAGNGALRATGIGAITVGANWTLEGRFFMTQLYGAAMVHVKGPGATGFWMGLNGGGRFTVESDSAGFSYREGEFPPDTGSWFYFCVTMSASGYMTMNAAQGGGSWNRAFTLPSNANFTSAGVARRDAGAPEPGRLPVPPLHRQCPLHKLRAVD